MTQQKTKDDDLDIKSPPIAFFWIITVLYVGWLAIEAYANWKYLLKLDIAGWGSLLAGASSPLAFFWLLYAALAQKAELGMQRRELKENNQTQREQQQQMKRQADALDAQIKRLNGQADAQYQPVFVLLTSGGIQNGLQLQIENLGASVIEISTSNNCEIISLLGGMGKGTPPPKNGVLSYWPSGTSVELNFLGNQEAGNDKKFTIKLKRLDNAKFCYEYGYLNEEQRIYLESKMEVE